MDTIQDFDGRFWIRTFWGFDPQNDGFIGFTHPGSRETFISLSSPGDIVLIYGGDSVETAPHQRAQALGFLRITHEIGLARDYQSDEGFARKTERGWLDRWNNAVKVDRAWHILTPISVKHLLPNSFHSKDQRLRGSRGVIVDSRDMVRIASLPVRESNVFGQLPFDVTSVADQAFSLKLSNIRGPKLTFGSVTTNRDDRASYLYLLEFRGPADMLVPENTLLKSRRVIKAGRSNDVEQRLSDLNAGFPATSRIGWHLMKQSELRGESLSVHNSEQALHDMLKQKAEHLGGEFYAIAETEALSAFAIASKSYRSYVSAE